MQVEVEWTELDDDRHGLWRASYCLYAYLHPSRDWLLYVGKADFQTVRQRLHGRQKDDLFRDLARKYDIDAMRTFHGGFIQPERTRVSAAPLADIESLLIFRLQPFGNIQSRQSRMSRPGLAVTCSGDWPFLRKGFRDDG